MRSSYSSAPPLSSSSSPLSYSARSSLQATAMPTSSWPSSSSLRSSLSSPSSTSYATRTHLPYVSQSMLVAHCLASPSSSTYSPSSATSLLNFQSSSVSRYSSSQSYGSSYSSSYTRPTRLSGLSSDQSSRSSYRTSASTYTAASTSSGFRRSAATTRNSLITPRTSYYITPLRLRERPLLTHIHSNLNSLPQHQRGGNNLKPTNTTTTIDNINQQTNYDIHSKQENSKLELNTNESNWQNDLTRNISRNKYLIKFREKSDKLPSQAQQLQSSTLTITTNETQICDLNKDIPENNQLLSDVTKEFESNLCLESKESIIDNSKVESTVKDSEETISHREVEQEFAVTNNSTIKEVENLSPDNESVLQTAKEDLIEDQSKISLKLKKIKQPKLLNKSRLKKNKETSEVANLSEDKSIKMSTEDEKVVDCIANNKTDIEIAIKSEKRILRPKIKTQAIEATSIIETIVSKEEDTHLQSDSVAPLCQDKVPQTNIVEKNVDKQQEVVGEIKIRKKNGKRAINKRQSSRELASIDGSDNKTTTIAMSNESKENDSRMQTLANQSETKTSTLVSQQHKKKKKSATMNVAKPAQICMQPIVRPICRFREYNSDDFELLCVLGHGGWGYVFLAELKDFNEFFAIKAIKKQTIVEDDDYDSIIIERKMLTLGNVNPFICKLFCTYQTNAYLFFVMEFCAGGDLMFHVQREGKFSESRCQFYAAEIICAIRFLHNRAIVYRDLKLDNILLCAAGHIRLVDFGMCQCRTYREEMLPSNFCGTPEYIAPEIIKGVPYNHSVDWWSFGVLLYEMAIGKMPFRGGDENELLWNVCYERIHYPLFLSQDLTSLLKLLLERDPELRLGMATCKAGDICHQPFFRGVRWSDVEAMKVKPPFVPQVSSQRDVQNFDADFTEAPVELSPVDESVITSIDQKLFADFPYTNPNMFHDNTECGSNKLS